LPPSFARSSFPGEKGGRKKVGITTHAERQKKGRLKKGQKKTERERTTRKQYGEALQRVTAQCVLLTG
jgi:hypothetical protein